LRKYLSVMTQITKGTLDKEKKPILSLMKNGVKQ